MHFIIKNLLEDFSKNHNFIDNTMESKQFEYFVNYLICSYKTANYNIQPLEVTTQEDDASIDGIAILVDDELVTTIEYLEDIFINSEKKLHDVKLILTQVKSGEKFEKKDMTNFFSGVYNFLLQDTIYPEGTFNKVRHEIFFKILSNVKKIRNQLPDIEVYYCTSGIYSETPESKGVLDLAYKQVDEKTYFNKIIVKALDRKNLIDMNESLSKDTSAKIKVEEFFAMPATTNIPQSHLAMVKAKDFVEMILKNDNAQDIRLGIFDENIRAYLGDQESVNSQIGASLQDLEHQKIFSILNNGITIIASDLFFSPSDKTLEITKYQIINGCQTSNVLFDHQALLTDDVKLIVKFINTTDSETINAIIASTNSQSHIDENAFLSLKDKTKLVQKYFIAMESKNTEDKIYFERRKNEFTRDIPSTRVFDLRTVVQAYNAMFLNEPFNSSRYVKKIFEDKDLFLQDDQESYYFVATFCLYKVNALINSKKFKHTFLKWHFLYAFKFLALKTLKGFDRNNGKATINTDNMIEILLNKEKLDKVIEEFNCLVEDLGVPTIDEAKRQKYTNELFKKIQLHIAK